MRYGEWYIGLVTFTVVLFGIEPARADHWPSYVVPARPDVPVIVNGVDASYAVVEGDWGLARPGHMAPLVYGPLLVPGPYRGRHYFPYTGRRPHYGRREVIPSANRILPPPAESYYRSWSTPPAPGVQAPASFYPPPVIYAPRADEGAALRRGN